MKKSFLLSLLLVFSVLGFAYANVPFTEDPINLQNDKIAETPDAANIANVEEQNRFPMTGTIEAASRLRLRSWPWGMVLGLFEPGTSLNIVGESGEFYKVEVNGQTGFMHKNYVSVPGKPASGVEPYYPGDTRNGGYLSITEGTAAATGKRNTSGNSSSGGTTTTPGASEAALASYKGGKLSPAEFGRLFGPVARENMRKTGVPASVTLAQAALETGWGSSSIGDARNLFGIKGTGPAGTIRVPTKEFINGRMVTINDNFRKYNSWQESFDDHAKLLQNSRYGYALKYNKDPNRYAQEIHKAGYATDPNYASKLISIMKANNFYQYDI